MDNLLTHSGLIISQPGGNPLLKTVAPSSQIYEWERQLPALQNQMPEAEVPTPDFSDLYIKPVPVRRYKIKARVRSVRKGTIY